MLIKSYLAKFEQFSIFLIFVIMQTEAYIQELLYRYNCVVVPEFGAFLTQMKAAALDRSSHTFYPPAKLISFNGQLSSNDGLLVSYMAQAEGVSYEEMLGKTLKTAAEWKDKLHKGERLELENIGELWRSREGKILFQPANKVNYLSAAFGLSSLVSVPVSREVLKEEVVQLEEKIPFIITPEQRQTYNFRPLLKYAAVVLLAISAGISGFSFYSEASSNQQMARQDAQEIISRNIQEATFFNTKPLELPVLTLEVAVKSKPTGNHHVIAGAFRIKANADKKVRRLQNKGFAASYLGENKYGLHQVSYGSFTDPEEALEFLKQIRQTETSDAWLLSIK